MRPFRFPLAVLSCLSAPAFAGQVVFTEVMYHPAAGKPEFIEAVNLTSNRLDMASWRLHGGVDYTFPAFNTSAPGDHFLKEYERILLSSASEAATRAAYPDIPAYIRIYGPWTGALNNAGDSFQLDNAAGAKQCSLKYGDRGKWPVAADGAGHSIVVINQDRAIDDWRNWRKSRASGGTPGNPEATSVEERVNINPEVAVGGTYNVTDFNSTPGTGSPAVPAAANAGDTKWRFYNQVAAPPANWAQPGFDPAGWGAEGYAPLGTENAAAPFIGIRTQVPIFTNLVSYYFRTTFNWSGPLTGNSFLIDQLIDDGVIYYLNGQEIGRDRMPNPEGHGNLADPTAVGDAALEEARITGGASSLDGKLVAGVNVLAASVHQNQASSSDMVFAARMKIVTSSPPGLLINEVKPGAAGKGFVEFYNPSASAIDLNGYYLSDSAANLTKFQITTSLLVPPLGFATVGFAESGLAFGSPVGVYLTQADGTTKQSAISATIPGDGRSLGRKPAGGSQWYLFATPTPGAANQSTGSENSPRLSEAHFNASGRVDWVEFASPTSTALSGAGLFVSSNATFSNKVALPASVPGNGYASVAVNFPTDGDGEVVLYVTDASNNVLETAEISYRAGLESVQRYPLTSQEWYRTPAPTKDAANNPERNTSIVINEIMYAPPSKQTDGEFIEFINKGATAVNLTGWRLTDGLDYNFPAGTNIAPGEYIVVAKSPSYMTATYGAGLRVFGSAEGKFKNSGDYIRLEDANGNTADTVDYKDGGAWPANAGGAGSSLELLHPDMDNSEPSSWRASDESTKSPYQTYTHTALYKELRTGTEGSQANGRPLTETRELLLSLVSDGHVALKSISLTKATAPATNLITTGDQTSHTGSGANGFLCTGTHRLSDTVGGEFHLISQGGGDTKGNKAEVDVTGIAPNDMLTLSFQARWISGLPLMVGQTWDRSFGKVFRLNVPNNLGTPGAPNSVTRPAAPPAVDAIRHSPAVPTSAQPVVVTARVSAPAGVPTVVLRERIDTVAGNGTWNTLPMNDNGTDGDAAAGDGVWSATVAPRADGTITQFYVRATAANGQVNECPRDAEGVNAVNGSVLRVVARPAMWIVDNTPPSTQPALLTERYVFSQYDRAAMNTGTGFSAAYDFDFPRSSNFGLNATIIMNESDILYGCELRKGGSPWTRTGDSSMERARWKPPGDNQFRERSKFAIDSDGSITNAPSRFHNRIARYMMYLFGYPVPDAEFVQQIVNADNPGWRDSMELTDSDFFDRAYGGGGELFEIDDAWYLYDTASMDDRLSADQVTARWSLLDWASVNSSVGALPSQESPIFFHANWPIRFPEDRYDYAALSSLIKTAWNNNTGVSNDTVYREQMERMIDTDRAAIYAAVRGYNGDWDNFTLNRGKNGYIYRRPTDGKFEFHHWDSDLAFQNTGEGFLGGAGGVGWTNYTGRPWFRQRFNYYLYELVTRYTRNSARMQAWLTAMDYQSANTHPNAPFKTAAFSYPNSWFAGRENPALNFIGSVNYNRVFSISTVGNQTVTTPLFTINGEGPSRIKSVEITGHPEAVFAFVPTTANQGLWTLTNISLASGLNALTVRALGSDGGIIGSINFNVTLSVNAPPVPVLTSSPSSRNVAANELITFDATASFDPEGTPLNFTWSVIPSSGFTEGHSVPAKAELRFYTPGVYTVTLTVADAALNTKTISRDISVYNTGDFNSFGTPTPLGPHFTIQNVENRDNFSTSAWYSLEDVTGRLSLQILEDSAKPLVSQNFTHPLITRDLPDTADFVLQTALMSDTRQFGDWQTGLWLETTENGATVRYAFSLEGGLSVLVKRAVLPAAYTTVSSVAVTGTGATLRVRRAGNSLIFQRMVNADWSTVHIQTLPAGAIAGNGGIFAATSQATSVRVGFDYLLVGDSSNANSVLSSLRITEIMYHPAGAGGIEFIELMNTGTQPIDIGGVYFEQGKPLDQFTFPARTMAPGSYIVVTNVTPAAFYAAYPSTPAGIVYQWPGGSLSNSGEEILLRDAAANVIQNFTYRDDPLANWPTAPDGGGVSLEILNTAGDYNSGLNWAAGTVPGGSPGYTGPATVVDTDGDGQSDSMELLAGTDPANGADFLSATVQGGPEGWTVSVMVKPGRTYHVENCDSLQTGSWVRRVSYSHPVASAAQMKGFTINDPPTSGTTRQFYRVVVEMTP